MTRIVLPETYGFACDAENAPALCFVFVCFECLMMQVRDEIVDCGLNYDPS